MYVLAGVVGIFLIWLFTTYNSLITLRNRVREAWSQIDVQLKRRSSLIPNLIETVKGVRDFEKQTLTDITEARSRWQGAKTPQQQVAAANELESSLARLLVVVETYPKLKSNEN